MYNFKVKAISDNDDIIDSNWSENSTYYVEKKLDAPAPKYNDSRDGGSISWKEVEHANYYLIFISKVGVNDEKPYQIEKKSSAIISRNDIDKYITKYNDIIENKDYSGEYNFSVQAINDRYNKVYLDSDVAKVQRKSDNTNITIIKPGKVTGIAVADNLLTWDEHNDALEYNVIYRSGDQKETHKPATNEENLKDRLDGELAGKVFNISISVGENPTKGMLAGVETDYMVDEKLGEYCYIPTEEEIEVVASGAFEGYKKVNNVGSLVYMLNDSTVDAKYYLEKDIDGKFANIYSGVSTFNGEFNANNAIIANLNLIAKGNSSSISLFGTIGANAVVKNLTLSSINAKNENEVLTDVAMLAKTNNGTIQFVNVVKSSIEVVCNAVGFVYENNGKINNCGLLNSSIIGKNNVAGVAIINNGEIFNASVIQNQITATSNDTQSCAGGVVAENAGSIANSFAYDSKVLANTYVKQVAAKAIAGGLVAVNSGSIESCYVTGKNNITKTIHANVAPNGADSINGYSSISYAGGLVGEAKSGTIKSCYVTAVKIIADEYASALIGFKDEANSISINSCFVYNFDLTAKNIARILVGTSNVTAEKVFYVNGMNNNANADNATGVARDKLIDTATELEGFAKSSDFPSYPILKNMLYEEDSEFSAEYTSTSTRDQVKVFVGSKADTKITEPTIKCSLVKDSKRNISFKVDVYTVAIDGGKTLSLPIFVTIK